MKQSTFSAVMANNIKNLWQRYSQSLRLLLVMLLTLTASTAWGQTTTTYTFSSKSWAASPANWTSGKDGNQMQSGRGIQVTTGATGANATSPKSFTNVSKIVVTYSTNASAGAGTIKIKIGSNTEVSQNVTKTGSTTDRTLTYNFSPNQTGSVKVTVTCSTNSIYLKSIAITEAAATVNHTVTWNVNGEVYETTKVTEGAKPTFPTTPSSCDATSTTFYGWATAAWDGKINDTNGKTIYTSANEMPAVNGAVTYYAVFAKATTTGGGTEEKDFSFNITKADFNTTSYAANNNEKTSIATASDASTMEVKWTSNQVMQQSGVMQWQKNTGYIFNSTDLGTIKSVEITKTDGTFTTYYGTTKQPTSGTTVGNGYFQIKIGNATGKSSNIKVIFTQTVAGGSTTTTYDNYITTCATGDPCDALQAPNVTATATANSITLLWDAVDGATSYNIYNFTTDKEYETTELTYTLTGLDPETEYEWEVEAVSATCNGKGTVGTTTTQKACTDAVNVIKGTPSNGSFTMVSGYQSTCNGSVTVTLSDIQPATGYQFSEITQSGVDDAKVTIDNTAKTVTYAQNTSGTSTINVTFIEVPTYTVTWMVNGEMIDHMFTTNITSGNPITLLPPSPAALAGCSTKVFVGWTTETIDSEIDTPPSKLYKELNDFPAVTADITYHAVWADEQGGGSEGWVLTDIANIDSDDAVVITMTTNNGVSYALPNNGGTSTPVASKINVTDNKLSSTPASTILWNISNEAGNLTIYPDGTTAKWLYCINDNDGVRVGTGTNKTFTITSGYLKNTGQSRYVGVYTTKPDWRCYENTTGNIANQTLGFYTYQSSTNSGYITTCCQQPINPLTVNADKTELVKSGVVTLTATGGNGRNIKWTTTGGLLSNESNTGATLTISDVDATQNITVTATQAVNDDDDLLCAQEASINITVKAQWTITFCTNDNGEKESNAMTVTDGEPYTMPDISDEYVCNSGSSFAGWVDKEDDTELDAMPNSTQTATADQTWYAAWSSSSATETVDVYQLVTDVANLAAGDKVWITNETPTVAMGIQNTNNRGQVGVVKHPTENNKIYSKGLPATLTIGKDGDNYTFHDGEGYLYAASSSSNYLKTKATLDGNGKWSISITDGKASIIAQGTNTRNTIRYNQSNNPPLFSCYASGQKDVKIYKYVGTSEIEVTGATITTNNTSCTRGAVISAENGKWVTSANGQKVRMAINVTARGFESNSTLTASSNNEHFKVSVPNSTINASTENITTIVVEYTPVESDIVEMAEITLKAGEATKIININGRSLPDEFVIVAQYNDKWLALPANMQSGADQYNGIEVTPNNALTQIPAAPNTTIYSLRGVAETRYETAGVCVRLVGNGNKCLWGNTSNTTTTIQNWTTLSKDNGENYEWLLTTSDGEQYTIACPAHPEYSAGRVLANSGQKFGLYKGTTNFYIMPVGCSALPGNVQVSPRRVDANFAWVSNASSMQIDVWTNEEMTEGKITQSTANSQYFFSGLKEKTQYWYKLTPDGNDACAVTGTFTTTGPTIDVVEWKENAVVIQVDKDDTLNPLVIIDGEVEHGVGGTKAKDIFFSKYFEAQSEAKLLAIYNGTANAISLADITILQRSTKHASNYTPLSLAPYGKIPGWIQLGEELILYNEDQSANSEAIMQCAKNDPTFSNWVKVDDVNLEFSGKGTIRLFRGNKCIDIIGAMGSADDIDDIEVNPLEGTEKPTFGDKEGFTTSTGDNYSTTNEETNYVLSTNRCLLVRKPSVASGAIAVEKNIGDFKTLGNDYNGIENEWAGLQVPNGPSGDKYKYTCEGFQKVGSFDYNKYYKEYNTIDNDTYLKDYSHDVNTNEYTIPIENLANYSCLNLRFQLKKDEEVLTETPVQVPIIVSGQKATNDAIFNAIVKDNETPLYTESMERCKTCNVVVLSEATLTKVTDETTNDVAQVHNVKVYPGGKLVIPVGTNYNVNSLSFRRQEEEVASAELKGNLNITASSDKPVYVDVRVNAENWHWFTLPYDCNIADVTWVDGTPAKYGVDWFLSTYDGEKRAATQSGGCWAEYHGETIEAGVGYIVGIAGHPTKSKVKYELRFPMSKEVLAQEVEGTDKTVPVYAWGVDEDMRPTHKGWNLVGNPYLDYYQKNNLNSFGGLRLGGKYVLNQSTGYYEDSHEWDGVTGNLPYVVVPINGGWSAYDQVLVSSIDLLPFTAYFVQVGNPETENNGDLKDVLFDGDNRGRASIARRAPSSLSETDEPVIVGVSLSNSQGESDMTSLVIDDKYTDEYEMNADFFKWFGDYYRYYTKPVLYTIGADKQQRAFNALNEEQAAKPISMGTYTAQNGEYTFSLDRRSDLTRVKEVWLHDATESAYVNLMQEDYSFATGKTDGTGRFTLAVTLHPKSPTDITEGMNGQVYVTSQQRMLYVNNLPKQARVWVYDAVGKLLVNETTNVYQRAYHLGQAGVYFVRVQSQNGCETLQAVVE